MAPGHDTENHLIDILLSPLFNITMYSTADIVSAVKTALKPEFLGLKRAIKSDEKRIGNLETDVHEIKTVVNHLSTKVDHLTTETGKHKTAIQELTERISFLPTRDEFYSKMDDMMTELVAIRQEQSVMSYRVSQHSDEITALQKLCTS